MDTEKLRTSAHRHLSKGRLPKAIADLQRAVELDKGDARTRLLLADLLQRNQQRELATKTWTDAARRYESSGSGLKALGVYLQVVRAYPDEHGAHLALGRSYAELALYSDAARHFAASLKAAGDDEALRLETIRAVVTLDPENLAARLRLGEAYAAVGRREEAARELRAVATSLDAKDADEAFRAVGTRAVELDPSDAHIARKLAAAHLKHDEPQRALPKLKLAFEQAPTDVQVLDLLAETFNQLGQVHKAVTVLKELGRVYEQTGLTHEKDDCFARILALDPNDKSARDALGGVGHEEDGQLIELGAAAALTQPSPVAPPSSAPAILAPVARPPVATAIPTPLAPETDDFDFDFDDDDDDEIGFGETAENTIVDDAFIPEDVRAQAAAEASIGLTLPGQAADASPQATNRLQEDLRELDFYINNGLVDEAMALIVELRGRHGEHPLLERRAREVQQLA